MNRGDRMLEVLRDGRTYSRAEITDRAGWLMTNNAAAELRARGYDIRHAKTRGLDVYWLEPLDASTAGAPVQGGPPTVVEASSGGLPNRQPDGDAPNLLRGPGPDDGPPLQIHADQLRLIEAA